ncbi:MAG: TetR/AcrR family transcriptional regulator C-terminal domain-containing protein [Sphingomonas sp.]
MARDTLERNQIVRAAIDLLDEKGLDGLTMRSLGKRLGSAATAVYWHVGSKENLVKLAGDRVWSEIDLPDLTTVTWRVAARAMAGDLHAMLVRHLWLVQAFGSYVIYGPAKARYDDHSLALYEMAGLDAAQADQAAAAVLIFVLGDALGHAAAVSYERKLRLDDGNTKRAMDDSMADAREIAAQFPRLRARMASPAADYATAPHDSFSFGLEAILDGVDARRRC